MLTISIPYKTGSLEQIPLKYILLNDFKIEANVFDINQLLTDESLKKLTQEIVGLQTIKKGIVNSLHFPTDNASYLENKDNYNGLLRAINICSEAGIPILVLHSNAIIPLNLHLKAQISDMRNKYISLIKDLDNYISDKNLNVKICLENMPIIGNDGSDFDSIFIFPEDFTFIKDLKNIAVTLDLCHWGFTCEFIKAVSNIHPYISTTKNVNFNDMNQIKNLIQHLHLSSFKVLTFPHTYIDCYEGVVPNQGLLLEEELVEFLHIMKNDDKDRLLTLEIREEDYSKRINFNKTVDWLNKNYIISPRPQD